MLALYSAIEIINCNIIYFSSQLSYAKIVYIIIIMSLLVTIQMLLQNAIPCIRISFLG